MKHSNFYQQYKKLEALEREELKKAILAHGGEFRFLTEDGEEIEGITAPIVMAGDSHWDSNCDCIITRVAVVDGYLEIYGYDKEYRDEELYLDDVEIGHLSYIIDEIPETDDVSDVSLESTIYEIPIVSLRREDIGDAGCDSDISNDEFRQVASRIGKYLEWQDFLSKFLENIRKTCDITKLNENE